MPASKVVEAIEHAVYVVAQSIMTGARGEQLNAYARSHLALPLLAQAKAFATPCRRAQTRTSCTSRSWTASCVRLLLRERSAA
jgi:hypothetical protein